ncbi:MAG TPA: SDR family oxidoreductase, partial [Desulfobulbus sp.]|nr:SDR family oxidoreductase [Desulfobulbus sp.]
DLYAEFGRIDGVIHGAGIIEDKLLVDKSPDSFARVVATKADSVFLLSRHLRPQSLKFLVLFSSVAGRFGNPGQCDYTAANEIVNKMARFLDARWPCRVVSVNWGPWAREGMVSPALERQFAERGVRLIDPEQGVAALLAEIAGGGRGEVEVILGDGPWGAVEEEACAR